MGDKRDFYQGEAGGGGGGLNKSLRGTEEGLRGGSHRPRRCS